jgi:RNA polymerase sigma-70 factor (ECF subfamily)
VALADFDVRALVEQHKKGDTSAFDEIVRRHAPRLLSHARMRLGDRQAAEDAVQETFLRAYRAMPRFDGDFHLQAWLHRICTNVCYDELDRRRRHGMAENRLSTEPTLQGSDADPDADLQTEAVRGRLSEALQQIPGPYREALVLHYGEHLPFREIALRTGVTEENARARASRGRRALRKLMAAPVAVMAFLIPALRRGQRAAVAADGGLPLDHATNVATVANVTAPSSSFVNQVVPTVARVMNDAGPLISNKAQLVTGAVAAASSVAVPVAATQVLDHESPKPPVAAISAPAPATTRVGALAAPNSTVITVPSGGKAAVAASPTTVTGAATATSPKSTATTVDPAIVGQLVPTTTTVVAGPAGATTTTGPGSTSTTTSGPATTVPVIPVTVGATGSVSTALSSGKGIDLKGELLLKGISNSTVSFTARATVDPGVATGDAPDKLVVVFTIGKAEFTVQGRGKVSDDGSTFVLAAGGQFSAARPDDLLALGLAKHGSASGTVGLKSGVPIKLSLG